MRIEFVEEGHKYLVDGKVVPSVTDIVSVLTARHYGSIPPDVLARAAQKGTEVHDWCESYDYGFTETEVSPDITGFLRGYMDFIRDYKPEWLQIEAIVADPDGRYCGRLDRFGLIDGRKAVLDIKTTSNPDRLAYLALSAQTAAYAEALGEPEARRYGLYLKKDGDYRLFDIDSFDAKSGANGHDLFKKCLELTEIVERATARKEKKA